METPPPFVSAGDATPVAPAPVRIDADKVLSLLDRSLDAQEQRWADLRARIERLERSSFH